MRRQSGSPLEGQHRTAIATNKRERAANSKTLHGFNMWLVGGCIDQKRELTKIDLSVTKGVHTGAVAIEGRIAQRKAQISVEQQRQGSQYHQKSTTSALRLDRIGVVQRGTGHDTKPHVEARPVSSPTVKLPHSPRQTALDVRSELKSSLLEHAAASSYVTLFPPMFTPMDHPVNHLRGWQPHLQGYHNELMSRPPTTQVQTIADIKRPTAGAHRGESVPTAFHPTGSAATAYRHFTNYRMAVQSTQAEEGAQGVASRAQHNDELQSILRKSLAKVQAPRGSGAGQPSLEQSMCTKSFASQGGHGRGQGPKYLATSSSSKAVVTPRKPAGGVVPPPSVSDTAAVEASVVGPVESS